MASHATHTLLGIQFQPFWYRTSQLSPKIRHNTGSIKLDMHININIQITENFYGLVLELTLCIQILVISEIQLINQVHLSQPKVFYEWAANLWKKNLISVLALYRLCRFIGWIYSPIQTPSPIPLLLLCRRRLLLQMHRTKLCMHENYNSTRLCPNWVIYQIVWSSRLSHSHSHYISISLIKISSFSSDNEPSRLTFSLSTPVDGS